MPHIQFDNSYATLPERFFSRVRPTPVAAPEWVRFNRPLAAYLGIDPALFDSKLGAEIAAGNLIPEGAEPIATVYAGHQFGAFNPQLGDGRAILLGETIATDGSRHDLQLKGAGITPYSRGGDGRSPLGPVLREYVVSEAMATLGIPTTRSLAAVATGERVRRDGPLPGGILLRVAKSHIRIGTFEYFAARGDREALQLLVERSVARHYPECGEAPLPALALLRCVAERQADLVARWQLVGFVHGVMNTDNMLISGETIDYGPCAFVDAYDPEAVYSSIDRHGRYAYANQPAIAQWNIAGLARALLLSLGDDGPQALGEAQAIVDAFPQRHALHHRVGLARKLGLSTQEAGDSELADGFLDALHAAGADFTLAFRRLTDLSTDAAAHAEESTVAALFEFPPTFGPWLQRWRQRLERDPRTPGVRTNDMRRANPALIPRNHVIAHALFDAEEAADFSRFHALVDALAEPFDYTPALAPFARPPEPHERVLQTFCGT